MIRNEPKQTISASGEVGLLQMVLESDTRRCANENADLPRGMDCEIPHRLKREMKTCLNKSMESSP